MAAAAGPLRVTNNAPSPKSLPLDVHELCAKLETAKREREEKEAAAELRRQVRLAVKNNGACDTQSARPAKASRKARPAPLIESNNNIQRPASDHASPTSPTTLHYLNQNLSWANVNITIPEHYPVDATSQPATARDSSSNVNLSRSTSTGDEDGTRKLPIKSTTKRRPFSIFKSLTSDDSTRRILAKDRPEDVAKRRSHTTPMLQTKFNNSTVENLPGSSRPSIAREQQRVEDHSMSFVNEYTVCFDTSPVNQERRHNRFSDIVESPQTLQPQQPLPPLPIDRLEWAARGDSNEGMRSLLNLSSVLKKDKKDRPRATVEEVSLPPPLPPPPKSYTEDAQAPRSRPHTRSNTAPEGLIQEAVRRIQSEEKGKKRRSMGALLQTILLPNTHSMSAPHCVAI